MFGNRAFQKLGSGAIFLTPPAEGNGRFNPGRSSSAGFAGLVESGDVQVAAKTAFSLRKKAQIPGANGKIRLEKKKKKKKTYGHQTWTTK